MYRLRNKERSSFFTFNINIKKWGLKKSFNDIKNKAEEKAQHLLHIQYNNRDTQQNLSLSLISPSLFTQPHLWDSSNNGLFFSVGLYKYPAQNPSQSLNFLLMFGYFLWFFWDCNTLNSSGSILAFAFFCRLSLWVCCRKALYTHQYIKP